MFVLQDTETYNTILLQSPHSRTSRAAKFKSCVVCHTLDQWPNHLTFTAQDGLLKCFSADTVASQHNLNPSSLRILTSQHLHRPLHILPTNLPLLLRHLAERERRKLIIRIEAFALGVSQPYTAARERQYHITAGIGECDVCVLFMRVDIEMIWRSWTDSCLWTEFGFVGCLGCEFAKF